MGKIDFYRKFIDDYCSQIIELYPFTISMWFKNKYVHGDLLHLFGLFQSHMHKHVQMKTKTKNKTKTALKAITRVTYCQLLQLSCIIFFPVFYFKYLSQIHTYMMTTCLPCTFVNGFFFLYYRLRPINCILCIGFRIEKLVQNELIPWVFLFFISWIRR